MDGAGSDYGNGYVHGDQTQRCRGRRAGELIHTCVYLTGRKEEGQACVQTLLFLPLFLLLLSSWAARVKYVPPPRAPRHMACLYLVAVTGKRT